MVDQLLDIARLKDQQAEVMTAKSVLATCDFLLASYQSLADERQIKLTLDNRLEHDLLVDMLPDALEKILSNLLTNAFKYTDDQQTICLSIDCNTLTDEVEISVADTGQGISVADQQQIFERFTRLENTQANGYGKIPGMGIGLALVKALIIQHKGTITVHSEVAAGSTFKVTLPVSLAIPLAQSNGAQVNQALVLSKVDEIKLQQPLLANEPINLQDDQLPLILVVEDNADMRQYIVSCLAERFSCVVAEDGEAGLVSAKEVLPDLIISDVMMPKMNGYALTKALKDDPMTSHIPLILLTAQGGQANRLKGWAEKADEFLQKPFNTMNC